MKRFTQLVVFAILTGIALVAIGGPLTAETAVSAPVVALEAPMVAFGADLGPMAELHSSAAFDSLNPSLWPPVPECNQGAYCRDDPSVCGFSGFCSSASWCCVCF